MQLIHFVMFNTLRTNGHTTQFVQSFDHLNEAEDMAISLNSMHHTEIQSKRPNPIIGLYNGEFDFFFVKTYQNINIESD